MQRASNALATGPATLGCRPDQHFGPAAQPAALTGSPTNRPPSFMSPRRPPLQATRAICIIKPAHLARHSSALVMRRRFDGNLSAGSSPSAPPLARFRRSAVTFPTQLQHFSKKRYAFTALLRKSVSTLQHFCEIRPKRKSCLTVPRRPHEKSAIRSVQETCDVKHAQP